MHTTGKAYDGLLSATVHAHSLFASYHGYFFPTSGGRLALIGISMSYSPILCHASHIGRRRAFILAMPTRPPSKALV